MHDKGTVEHWKSQLEMFRKSEDVYLTEDSENRNRLLYEDFIRFTSPSGLVLDIGCGSGDFGRCIDFRNYIGIDPIVCRTKDFHFVQGVGEYIPFKDATFNCIVTLQALDHCLNPARVLEECKRLLQDSGRLFIWLKATRTKPEYKIRRAIQYLRALDFFCRCIAA